MEYGGWRWGDDDYHITHTNTYVVLVRSRGIKSLQVIAWTSVLGEQVGNWFFHVALGLVLCLLVSLSFLSISFFPCSFPIFLFFSSGIMLAMMSRIA